MLLRRSGFISLEAVKVVRWFMFFVSFPRSYFVFSHRAIARSSDNGAIEPIDRSSKRSIDRASDRAIERSTSGPSSQRSIEDRTNDAME